MELLRPISRFGLGNMHSPIDCQSEFLKLILMLAGEVPFFIIAPTVYAGADASVILSQYISLVISANAPLMLSLKHPIYSPPHISPEFLFPCIKELFMSITSIFNGFE